MDLVLEDVGQSGAVELRRRILGVNLRTLLNDNSEQLNHQDRGLVLTVYYALQLRVDETTLARLIAILVDYAADKRILEFVDARAKTDYVLQVRDSTRNRIQINGRLEYKRIKALQRAKKFDGEADYVARDASALMARHPNISIERLWVELGHYDCRKIEAENLVSRLVHYVSPLADPANLINILKVVITVDAINRGSSLDKTHLTLFVGVMGARQRLLQQLYLAIRFNFPLDCVRQSLEVLALYDYRKGNNTTFLCVYNQVICADRQMPVLDAERNDSLPMIMSEKDLQDSAKRNRAIPIVLQQIRDRHKSDVSDLFESGHTASDIVLAYYSQDVSVWKVGGFVSPKQTRKRSGSRASRRSQARVGGAKKPDKACLARLFSALNNNIDADLLVKILRELSAMEGGESSAYVKLIAVILNHPVIYAAVQGQDAVVDVSEKEARLGLLEQLKTIFMMISFNSKGDLGPYTDFMKKFLDSSGSDKKLKRVLVDLRCALENGASDSVLISILFKLLIQEKGQKMLGAFSVALRELFVKQVQFYGIESSVRFAVSPRNKRRPVKLRVNQYQAALRSFLHMLVDSNFNDGGFERWRSQFGMYHWLINSLDVYGRAPLCSLSLKNARSKFAVTLREHTIGRMMADEVCTALDFSDNEELAKIDREALTYKLHATIATIVIPWGQGWKKDRKYLVLVLKLKLLNYLQAFPAGSEKALYDRIRDFVVEWNQAIVSRVTIETLAHVPVGVDFARQVLAVVNCLNSMMDINKLPNLIPIAVKRAYAYLKSNGHLDGFPMLWTKLKDTKLLGLVVYLQLKAELNTNTDKFKRNIEEGQRDGEMSVYEKAVTLATYFGFLHELVVKKPKGSKPSTAGIRLNTCIPERQRGELLVCVERVRAIAWRMVGASGFDFVAIEHARQRLFEERLAVERLGQEDSSATVKAFRERRETFGVMKAYAEGERYIAMEPVRLGDDSPVVAVSSSDSEEGTGIENAYPDDNAVTAIYSGVAL